MTAPLHDVEWWHPRLGAIRETVCLAHERQLLAAIKTLGMGLAGTSAENPDAECRRCFGGDPRTWLEFYKATAPAERASEVTP